MLYSEQLLPNLLEGDLHKTDR